MKILKFTSPTMHHLSVLEGIWWPNFHIIEEAMLDPTGDIPSEHTRAELLRRSFLLFALELVLRSHTHIHTHFSTHIHSLSAFFTLLHQSVPKLFPHFGEFPRLIPWHKWILGLITLAWTHQVCPEPAKCARSKNSYLPLLAFELLTEISTLWVQGCKIQHQH